MSIEEKIHILRGKAMTSGFSDSHFKMYHGLRQDVESFTDLILPEVKKLEKENAELKDLLEQSEVDRKSATLQCESMRKDQNTLSAVEKENKELREERQELAESMLNIIGIVRRVSGDAYRCINHKFIDRLEKLEGGE